MHLAPGVACDQADNAFDLRRLEGTTGLHPTFAEPVEPEHAVRVDHDFDDQGIGKRRRDRRAHGRPQHRAAALGGLVGAHAVSSAPTLCDQMADDACSRRPSEARHQVGGTRALR
jgi:hypothetical protein